MKVERKPEATMLQEKLNMYRNQKTTSQISACVKTYKLWRLIADMVDEPVGIDDRGYGARSNFVIKVKKEAASALGYSGMLYNCPCCEFNGKAWPSDKPCINCPMIDFWDCTDMPISDSDRYWTPCSMHEGSPYYFFRIDPHHHNAVLMYQTAKAAMEYWMAMREMNEVW